MRFKEDMKKEFVFAVLLLILSSFLVLAQESSVGNITQGLENISSVSSTFNERTNEMLAKEIEIPENLKFFTRILFGLKADDTIDLQSFVISVCVFVIILLLIKSIVEIISFIGKGVKAWMVAFLVTVLTAISGGFQFIIGWIFSISMFFGLLEKRGVARLAILLVILLGLFYLISKVISILKGKAELEESHQRGRNIGWASFMGNIFKKTSEKD